MALTRAARHEGDDGFEHFPLRIVAVADGAGSARFSEEGARVAVDFVVADVKRGLESLDTVAWLDGSEGVLRGALRSAHSALADIASLRGAAIGDFACTMIVVVLGTDAMSGIQVGDGAVVVSVAPDHVACLTVSLPQKSEYFNEVCFLTSSGFETEARFFTRDRQAGPTRAVAVFSDGLELLALNVSNGEPHAGFFRPLFSFMDSSTDLQVAQEELAVFLASRRVGERTDDDKTLILAVSVESASEVDAGA